jgi:hypothetical protein
MDDVDLDTYLETISGSLTEKKFNYYEAILASLLRKYVAEGNKIELNLNHVYKDTYLDVTINHEDPSKVKVTWREISADI